MKADEKYKRTEMVVPQKNQYYKRAKFHYAIDPKLHLVVSPQWPAVQIHFVLRLQAEYDVPGLHFDAPRVIAAGVKIAGTQTITAITTATADSCNYNHATLQTTTKIMISDSKNNSYSNNNNSEDPKTHLKLGLRQISHLGHKSTWTIKEFVMFTRQWYLAKWMAENSPALSRKTRILKQRMQCALQLEEKVVKTTMEKLFYFHWFTWNFECLKSRPYLSSKKKKNQYSTTLLLFWLRCTSAMCEHCAALTVYDIRPFGFSVWSSWCNFLFRW